MVSTERGGSVANYIAIVVVLLMAVGTVFVFSAGATVSGDLDLQRFYDFPCLRQIVFFPLAVVIMFGVSAVDYRRFDLSRGWLKTPVSYALVVSIALLALVLSQRFHPVFPKLIPAINEHYRWLKIPAGAISISFQASELAKWTVVFFVAGFCVKYSDSIALYWKRFVWVCMVIGVVAGLIMVEDFGTAAFIALLGFVLLVIGGAKWWHLLTPAPVGIAAFLAAIVTSPGRIRRITAFLHPEELAGSAAYQATQSLIALGSGGLWGKGLGRGICKYGHLPEDTTDFIFAIIGEELGFLGTAAVIGLFICFVWLGILVVVRCREGFGQLLAAGIVLTIAIQAAINIAVVTVVLPTKGITLPFVSAGGTSMLLSAGAVGVLLNIAKQSAAGRTEEPA